MRPNPTSGAGRRSRAGGPGMGFCSLSPPGTKTAVVSRRAGGRRPQLACREVCLEEECPRGPASRLLIPTHAFKGPTEAMWKGPHTTTALKTLFFKLESSLSSTRSVFSLSLFLRSGTPGVTRTRRHGSSAGFLSEKRGGRFMPLDQPARRLVGPSGRGPELGQGFSLTGAGSSSEASSWGTTCTLPSSR